MDHSFNKSQYDENDVRLCYLEGQPEECVRISVMMTLSLVTGLACFVRIMQFHCYKSTNYPQFIIYYIATLITVLCAIHWSYLHTSILDLVSTYLTVLQLMVICYMFCSWAARLLQKETLFKRVIVPFLVLATLYFTGILIWACIKVIEASKDCSIPHWILFSLSELLLVQFFLVSVIYITKKLTLVMTPRINRLSQKFQLWGLVIIYELVAIPVFIYDMYFVIASSLSNKDCKAQLPDNKPAFVILYIAHKFLKYFLAQWGIIVIFSPLKRPQPVEDDPSPSSSWTSPVPHASFFSDSEKLIHYPINAPPAAVSRHPSYGGATPSLPGSGSSWLRASQTFKTVIQ
ncbi:hypothetical protein EMCRGX_G025495 [Ephydatia muelleri]|eukprot:Em0021g318a